MNRHSPEWALSPQQRQRLAELRMSPDGKLAAPRGLLGHATPSWWQTSRSLIARGYADADGEQGIKLPLYRPGHAEAIKASVVRQWLALRAAVQPLNMNRIAEGANLTIDLTHAAVHALVREGVLRKAKT